VTGRVVEARIGNMATANRLAVLQKVKQEKGVSFWSFVNDLRKKQAKCEKWKAVTKIAESESGDGEALAVLPRHCVVRLVRKGIGV